MKLTTKGRYAVTAMIDLSLNDNEGPVSLLEISERQSISLSYLEQLFSRLRKQGLVVSARGPGGGYRLSRDIFGIVRMNPDRGVRKAAFETLLGTYAASPPALPALEKLYSVTASILPRPRCSA